MRPSKTAGGLGAAEIKGQGEIWVSVPGTGGVPAVDKKDTLRLQIKAPNQKPYRQALCRVSLQAASGNELLSGQW